MLFAAVNDDFVVPKTSRWIGYKAYLLLSVKLYKECISDTTPSVYGLTAVGFLIGIRYK